MMRLTSDNAVPHARAVSTYPEMREASTVVGVIKTMMVMPRPATALCVCLSSVFMGMRSGDRKQRITA